MPRTGETYTLPPDVKGAPNTPILSAPYNAVLDDFAKDANTPRPVSAGGTGAQTRQAAVNNLFEGNSVVKDTNLLVAAFGNTTRRFRLDVGAVPDDTTRTVTMPSVSFSISDAVAPILGKPLLSDVQKALGISLNPIDKELMIGSTPTAVKADNAAFWRLIGGGSTLNLAAATTLGAGWSIALHNWTGTDVDIKPTGTDTINGAAAKINVAKNSSLIIACDGTGFKTLFWDELLINDKITFALNRLTAQPNLWLQSQAIQTPTGYCVNLKSANNSPQIRLENGDGSGSTTIGAFKESSIMVTTIGTVGFTDVKITHGQTTSIRLGGYVPLSPTGFEGAYISEAGQIELNAASAISEFRIRFNISGTAVGSITTFANSTAYNTSSDYRLKPIVESLVDFSLTANQFAMLPDALRRVMALRPVRHNWENAPDTWTHGFVAHEAQPIIPHAVTGEKDAVEAIGTAIIPEEHIPAMVTENGEKIPAHTVPASEVNGIPEGDAPEGSAWIKTGERPVYQGIDTGKMVADLTAAIQGLTLLVLDQQARIDALEARP